MAGPRATGNGAVPYARGARLLSPGPGKFARDRPSRYGQRRAPPVVRARLSANMAGPRATGNGAVPYWFGLA